MSNSMRKENFEDIQEEHRKILETIESALQKLNSVSLKLMNKIDTNIHQLNEKKFVGTNTYIRAIQSQSAETQ